MTKQFSLLQLFSILDGRLSTNMGDVYDILNHICADNLFTHHLPVALDYLRHKNPEWFQTYQEKLQSIAKTHFYTPEMDDATFTFKDAPFAEFIKVIKEKYNDKVPVPQLIDEFDTSDFGDFMLNNSLLLKK